MAYREITPHYCRYDKKTILRSEWRKIVSDEVRHSMMNTVEDALITTNVGNIQTLSGATNQIKSLDYFTGKVSLFLPWHL